MRSIYGLFMIILLAGCKYAEVDPGKLFRSPQLDAKQLNESIHKFGIKTIINLRGPNPGKDWYDQERQVAEAHGVKMIDIPMSAGRLPHKHDLIKLLDAYRTAARPILIHCMAGVDRTGEAAAIYMMLYMGATREESLEMLSEKFGYIESMKPAKKYFIEHLWQGEEWARKEYEPCNGQYPYYDAANECQGHSSTPPDDES